jgi:hypothetical protein
LWKKIPLFLADSKRLAGWEARKPEGWKAGKLSIAHKLMLIADSLKKPENDSLIVYR